MRGSVLGLITLPWLVGCSVFGVNTVEEAGYQVRSSEGDFEIRDYAPLVMVETVVKGDWESAGSEAFGRLFRYISGDNTASSEIAMTAPVIADQSANGQRIDMTASVIQEGDASGWRYRFVLPASFTYESAPKPLNETVQLVAEPAKRMAVVRFSGLSDESDVEQQSIRLLQWIESRGLTARSIPRWAGYNPPWTIPFLRRNEILVEVN